MGQGANEMNHRSTEEIRRDILHTEAEIAGTIHSIEDRISPENLKRRAMAWFREKLSTASGQARTYMKEKPAVPAAAAGAAILLLGTMAARKKKRMRSAPEPSGEGSGKSVFLGIAGIAVGAALAAMMPAARSAAAAAVGKATATRTGAGEPTPEYVA